MGYLKHRVGRFASFFKRSLPDFMIIGAQKSGTTSLYSYMAQHPQILPAFRKEIHYFDTKFYRGSAWYRSNFPFKNELENSITGEASPAYLFHVNVPERIYKLLPDCKFIIILRNPADRAISHYYHYRRNGKENLPMQQAFDYEENRISQARKKLKRRSPFGMYKNSMQYRRYSYLARGRYIEQIEPYLRLFKTGQFYIQSSEFFFENPYIVLEEIFRFLEIDTNFQPSDLTPKKKASYPDVDNDFYERLKNYYTPYNEQLYERLGRRFDW